MANILKDKGIDKQKKCNSCCQMIDSSAKVCHYCGRHQNFWVRHFGDTAIIISFVMVIISVAQLIGAFKQNVDASRAKETAEKSAIDANTALTKVLSDANEIEKLKQQLLEQREILNLWINIEEDESIESTIMYFNELESKEPNDWRIYEGRAFAYYQKAEYIAENIDKKKELLLKAKSDYEKSYERHKGKSIIHLADICAELNDEEGCRKWLEQGMTDNSLPSLKETTVFSYNIKKYSDRDWFKKINWKENK